MRIRDRHEVFGGTLRHEPDSDKDLEGSTVYLGLGKLWHTCYSATCFFSYRMASLTGRLVGATPVGEMDVVVESQEYDGYAKSIRGKAV
jgi:hypothetical protein